MPPFNTATKGAKCEDLEKVVIGGDSEKFFQIRAQLPAEESQPEPKKARVNSYPTLSFSEEDKIGTT